MDTNVLITKISSLANNLNDKARKFKTSGYGDAFFKEFDTLTTKYDEKVNLRTDSGFLAKGKKFLETQYNKGILSHDELIDIYSTYSRLQHDTRIGTVKKYEAYIAKKHQAFDQAMERLFGDDAPKFMSDEERKLFIDALEENRQNKKFPISDQVIINLYNDIYADEDEQEELEQVIRKQKESSERLEKYLVGNKLPQRGGNKR